MSKKWGDRKDGKLLRKIDSMHYIMPLMYPNRCDNEASMNFRIDLTKAEEYLEKKNYEGTNVEDYLHITLLDEEEVYDAIGRLRSIYPNIMRIDYENRRTSADNEIGTVDVGSGKSAIELFEELFRIQNNKDFTDSQRELCAEIIGEIWEVAK